MKTNKNLSLLVSIFLTLAILLLSCEEKKTSSSRHSPIIARVGTTKLTKAELLAQLPEELNVTPENLPFILDKWINSELLYQEAERLGLTKDEKLKVQAKQLAKEFFVNALLKKEAAKIKVPTSELLAYFNQHKEDFLSEVKIRRIVLNSEELAERTLAELKSGADFVKLAKERSIEPTSERGEVSRFFARGITGVTDPSLEEAIFALKPGQFTDVLETSEGYQIIQLVEKRKVKKDISFSEVADYIESILTYKMSRTRIDSIINDLRQKGKYETFPNAFFSTK
jgi:parvulin-like peptidyl-prolyl isomerase